MKQKIVVLLGLIVFCLISEAECTATKAAKCPSQKELNELTLLLTRYSNNPEGVPPLHYAILKKDVKAVGLLLKHGASPLSKDGGNRSCLYYAIRAGNIQLIKQFITLGNSVIDMGNREKHHNFDALQAALVTQQYEQAKYFIISGLLPSDIIEKSFLYLVHPAPAYQILTTEQKKTLLLLMVSHGADINAVMRDNSNQTPFQYLLSGDPSNTEMADFLRSLGAK